MYESRKQRLLTRTEFVLRIVGHVSIGFGVVALVLTIGVLGYHFLAHMTPVDALLNASMILGGMGPVDPVKGTAAKIFASFYALFSGLVFIALLGLLLGPFMHRLMHRFHMDEEAETKKAP